MTTPIPPSNINPDSVARRLGLVKFFVGIPADAASYCYLDL
jgi:hypothetical protein